LCALCGKRFAVRVERTKLNRGYKQTAKAQDCHQNPMTKREPQAELRHDHKSTGNPDTGKRNPARLPTPRKQQVVRNYLFRIFDKTGVSTRVELAIRCLAENQQEGSNGQARA
jgi:hypothetical protein